MSLFAFLTDFESMMPIGGIVVVLMVCVVVAAVPSVMIVVVSVVVVALDVDDIDHGKWDWRARGAGNDYGATRQDGESDAGGECSIDNGVHLVPFRIERSWGRCLVSMGKIPGEIPTAAPRAF
jgi:hypothetical protein